MDGYSTHLEALVETAVTTDGPLCELGCGDYSTPILAAIARQQGRTFKVQCSDPECASRFKSYVDVQMVDWATWEPTGEWGMVFLDNEQFVRDRILQIPALSKVAKVLVMHDADVAVGMANWQQCISGYKEIAMYRRYTPWTAVLR